MALRRGSKRARSPSPAPPPPPSFKASKSLRKSIQDQTSVALEITKQLLLTEEGMDMNVVFSPLSIHVVLSMIAAGTKGFNQEEMLNFLKSKSIHELNTLASNVIPLVFADGSEHGGPLLSFANGVWIDESLSIKPSFKNVLDTDYKATLKQVDFKTEPEEVRHKVNSWGEKKTNGLIKSILPPMSVSRTTRLILANAVYFKGEWDEEFDASETRVYKFNLLHNGGSVKARFMTKSSKQFISVFQSFKVLKLPYKQGKDHERMFSMYIFLPNARNGLRALVEKFCSKFEFIDSHLPYIEVPVGEFLIPKFKISCGFEASKLLETLGFSPGSLTEMVDSPEPLHVSNIFHKAFIEVNEKGTEAAAVTAFVVTTCSFPPRPLPDPIDFVADHPFLYLIREEVTKTVMFVGQVLNPIEDLFIS
ncbi:serpin-ZX-like [Rosa rugosa]|uniref:serpin-ZX-like n=1 Tax=Rosa rugosa TaxID=74645 RepID=UPI002B40D487|nr:serpin-ZX-like [Rosa rugosa]